jgi:hypothetical protein
MDNYKIFLQYTKQINCSYYYLKFTVDNFGLSSEASVKCRGTTSQLIYDIISSEGSFTRSKGEVADNKRIYLAHLFH